jgi:D-glycerate 3-kinase
MESQTALEYPTITMRDRAVEHLLDANTQLRGNCDLLTVPQHLDFLAHLNANTSVDVHQWQMQQDRAPCARTDQQVVRFLKGYIPGL